MTCTACNGIGKWYEIRETPSYGMYAYSYVVLCPACNGTGARNDGKE